jgi:DNA polymerase III epsilon subunit-like protein
MKYISIDIETSGLNPDMNNVLSIGAIIEDTTKKLPYEELPKFNAIILQNNIQGSPRAITMNKEIITLMGDYLECDNETRKLIEERSEYIFCEEDTVAQKFYDFLWVNGYMMHMEVLKTIRVVDGSSLPMFNSQTPPITINVAGKNFGTFDKLFLEQLPWWKKLIRTRQRVLDPSILCVDWVNDKTLPSLTDCKNRMGVSGIVTHNALEDAWDVIEILRKFY